MPMKRVAHMPMKRITSKRKLTLSTEPHSDAGQWRIFETEARMARTERSIQAAFQHVGLQPPQMEYNDEAPPSRSWSDVVARIERDLNARMDRIERHMQTLIEYTRINPPPTP